MTNPNSSETSSTDNNQPPTPPKMQNNTKKLVKEGILEEVPSTVGVGEAIYNHLSYDVSKWMLDAI